MIGDVTLGVNDLDRAHRFYDALMPELGAKRLMSIPDDPNGLTFYGAYWRDPDGNKFCAFRVG